MHSTIEQRRFWDQSARAIEKWLPVIQSAAKQLTDRMIAISNIKPGSTVLDIATGLGDPAIDIAKKILHHGHVIAIDSSSERIRIARMRSEQEDLNIEFIEGDFEKVDLAYQFDAVFCRWGLMFFPDLPFALRKINRLLLPKSGTFVSAVWAEKEKVHTTRLISLILEQLGLAPPPTIVDPFSLANPNKLTSMLVDSGFSDISHETILVTYRFDSAKTLIRYMHDTNSSFRAFSDSVTKESNQNISDIERVIQKVAEPYCDSSGNIVLPNESILTSCTKR